MIFGYILQFVLVYWQLILKYVLEEGNVLKMIFVNAQVQLVMNVKYQHVLEFLLMIQMFAQVMDNVYHQTNAHVKKIGLVHNVKSRNALVF